MGRRGLTSARARRGEPAVDPDGLAIFGSTGSNTSLVSPSKQSAADLFAAANRYRLPVYQRAYTWTENGQWGRLWADVQEQAERRLTSGMGGDTPRPHFFGSVVVQPEPHSGDGPPPLRVVDGQQRLLTLQVLLAVLRDLSADGPLHDRLAAATTLPSGASSTQCVPRIEPTEGDRDAFRTAVTGGSLAAVEATRPRDRPPFADAYRFFHDRVRQFVTDSPADADERLAAVADAVLDGLETVVVMLDDGDDPQVVFESLNGRSEPLLPSDLVRNALLLHAAREPRSPSSPPFSEQALYDRHWCRYDAGPDAPYWRGRVKLGRDDHGRLDLLLFYFLEAQTARPVRVPDLYRAFRDWWETEARRADNELGRLTRYADAFERLFAPPRSGRRYDEVARRLRDLNTHTAHPVLLYLDTESGLDPDGLDAAAGHIESFIVRRLFAGLTTKNLNRHFLALVAELRQTPDVTPNDVQIFLARGEGDSVRWPDDAEFAKGWKVTPLYKAASKAGARAVLEALNEAIDPYNQRARGLTVEHVLPQNPACPADWPLLLDETGNNLLAAFPGSDFVGKVYAEVSRQALHTVGNLTLLPAALNTSVSNGPFVLKRQALAHESDLALNRYFRDLPPASPWTVDAIQARADSLFPVARALWPHAAP